MICIKGKVREDSIGKEHNDYILHACMNALVAYTPHAHPHITCISHTLHYCNKEVHLVIVHSSTTYPYAPTHVSMHIHIHTYMHYIVQCNSSMQFTTQWPGLPPLYRSRVSFLLAPLWLQPCLGSLPLLTPRLEIASKYANTFRHC
jgi:hypothetical protein